MLREPLILRSGRTIASSRPPRAYARLVGRFSFHHIVGAPAVQGAVLQCCCCLASVAITSDGRAPAGRGCATTSLSQFPHALCSTFGAVASLRHKPPTLDTRWLGGWPSQFPLPFSVLPTYPVPSRISGDKPCTLDAHPCSMSPRLLSHGLHAPLSK